jgi:hypothetical protein
MQRRARKVISYGICEPILVAHPIVRHVAKSALVSPLFIGLADRSKICRITVSLHRIAAIAQGLEVREVIGPAVVAWDDMVDLERLFIRCNATQLAAKLRPLEDLITQCATDIASRFPPMVPDAFSPALDVGGQLRLTELDEIGNILGREFVKADQSIGLAGSDDNLMACKT